MSNLQDIAFKARDTSHTIAVLGSKLDTRVDGQVAAVDILETKVQDMQAGCGGS